jgi:hypothetical protein
MRATTAMSPTKDAIRIMVAGPTSSPIRSREHSWFNAGPPQLCERRGERQTEWTRTRQVSSIAEEEIEQNEDDEVQ